MKVSVENVMRRLHGNATGKPLQFRQPTGCPPTLTTLASKGQVTIPKQIRDTLSMATGCSVDFAVNGECDVVIHKVGAWPGRKPDRFESARGKVDVIRRG